MLNLVGRIERDHSHSLSLTEGPCSIPCQFTLTLSPAEHVIPAAELNRRAAAAAAGWRNRSANGRRTRERRLRRLRRKRRTRSEIRRGRRPRECRLESVSSVVAAEDVELRLGCCAEGERENEKRFDHCNGVMTLDSKDWMVSGNKDRSYIPFSFAFLTNNFNERQFAYAAAWC